MAEDKPQIKIMKDGPYVVSGSVPLRQDAIVEKGGHAPMEYRIVKEYEVKDTYALCRCGHSKNKPYCDGAHSTVGFDGTETADKTPYLERADQYAGPAVTLYDDNRCAFARFCHQKDGDVWTLAQSVTKAGEEEVEAIAGSCMCPAGRLELHNNTTGEVYEQEAEPEIIILEDPGEKSSAAIFVRGGIPLIGADGEPYELRKRYALCRCGNSGNKPFCDAMHVNEHFNDGNTAIDGEVIGEPDEKLEKLPDA